MQTHIQSQTQLIILYPRLGYDRGAWVNKKPVAFPRMNDFWIGDGVQASGRVELIKEKFNNWWKRRVGMQDCRKQVVDVLLQGTLSQQQQVLFKVIWEERVAILTSENALSHCVCYIYRCTTCNVMKLLENVTKALQKRYGTLQERYGAVAECCGRYENVTEAVRISLGWSRLKLETVNK